MALKDAHGRNYAGRGGGSSNFNFGSDHKICECGTVSIKPKNGGDFFAEFLLRPAIWFGDKEVVVIVGERPGGLFAVCAMQRRIEYAIMRKRPLSSGDVRQRMEGG